MLTFILLSWYPVGVVLAYLMAQPRTYQDLGQVIFVGIFGYLYLFAVILVWVVESEWWYRKLPWVK
jgi:hypothetical protein